MRAALAAAVLALLTLLPLMAFAQNAASLETLLADNRDQIERPSRQTIGPVIAALANSGDPQAAAFLAAWADRGVGLRKADGAFFLITETDGGYSLRALDGTEAGTAPRADITELLPNAGVRAIIATA